MKHKARPFSMLLMLCLLLAVVWTASGMNLQLAAPIQGVDRVVDLAPVITPSIPDLVKTPKPEPTVPPTREPVNVQDLVEFHAWKGISPQIRESLNESIWRLAQELFADQLDIDWENLSWIYHGYVKADSDGAAPAYKRPENDAQIVTRLPDRYHLFRFASLPNYPGWYVVSQHLEGMSSADGLVFLRSGNVEIPADPYADVVSDITWWEGAVTKVDGGVPVYDGPGTGFPLIHRHQGGAVSAGALWPPDPNWVIIIDNDLINLGYGDGRGFIEARHFKMGDKPAK